MARFRGRAAPQCRTRKSSGECRLGASASGTSRQAPAGPTPPPWPQISSGRLLPRRRKLIVARSRGESQEPVARTVVIGYLRQYLRYKCMTSGNPFAWSSEWEKLQWPLSVAFSVIVGIAMAMIVEQPVLKLRDRWFPSRTRLTSDAGSGSPESLPPQPQPRSMSAKA